MRFLQLALNKYLALDPESKNRVYKLRDKVITIELLAISLTMQLCFTKDQVEIRQKNFLVADTTIKGTPLNLMSMVLSKHRNKFFAEDVVILGDAEIGQDVIKLFDELEIDWEEMLSHWIGDVPSHHLGRVVKKFKKWGNDTRETLLQNINEYLHEEINLFPSKRALEDFFQDIDVLRMDVDRIAARISLLGKGASE